MTRPSTPPQVSPIPHPILGGTRPVAGLWWPDGWLAPMARRLDVLRHWTSGATLHRFQGTQDASGAPGGLLLRLPAPTTLDCARLSAWPLQRVAGCLCSAAVSPADLAGLPVADAWLVEAGQWRPLRLAEARQEDVSSWLETDLPLLRPLDLRQPAPERALAIGDARPLTGVLGPAVPQSRAPGTQALMDAMAQAARAGARAKGRQGHGEHPGRQASGATGPLAGALGTVVAAVVGGAAGLAAGVGGTAAQWLRQRFPRLPAVPERWRQWMARLAVTTGMSRLLGAQHSAYMRRMLRMFDDGQLDEALRHALPLGGDSGSLGQAFGTPGRRQDLRLSANGTGASASIHLDDELENHLRQLYRRTAQQLEAAGRIDEAVFVHAELLRDHQAALEVLERHGRYAQAAELAYGWDMPPATIIRLHALAGDWRRAELVARRDGAWAAALELLEHRWPEVGRRLRHQWAEALTQQGRWLDAMRTLWPDTAQRHRAAAWLEAAEAAGGLLATRALAWRALGWPETMDSRQDAIAALHGEPALAPARTALVDELLRLPGNPNTAVRRLALMVTGATLAEQAGDTASLPASRLQQLVQLTGDEGLKADLPPPRSASIGRTEVALALQATPLEGLVPAPGPHPVKDVVILANDELLMAFGEAGAARVDGRGRRLAHFAVPADVLVVAEDGCSALALARRDAVWRVTRLDLMHGRSVDLGLHAFDTFADRFDGIGWSVGIGRKVQVLEVHVPGLREVLWQVADLPAPVLRIERGDLQETWLLGSQHELHQWSYQLPVRRLKYREPVAPLTEAQAAARETQGPLRFLAGERGLLEFEPADTGTATTTARWLRETRTGIRLGSFDMTGVEVLKSDGQWLALCTLGAALETPEGPRRPLRLHQASGPCKLEWRWPTTTVPRLRCQGTRWLVFDNEGRVATIDLKTSAQTARSSSLAR